MPILHCQSGSVVFKSASKTTSPIKPSPTASENIATPSTTKLPETPSSWRWLPPPESTNHASSHSTCGLGVVAARYQPSWLARFARGQPAYDAEIAQTLHRSTARRTEDRSSTCAHRVIRKSASQGLDVDGVALLTESNGTTQHSRPTERRVPQLRVRVGPVATAGALVTVERGARRIV